MTLSPSASTSTSLVPKSVAKKSPGDFPIFRRVREQYRHVRVVKHERHMIIKNEAKLKDTYGASRTCPKRRRVFATLNRTLATPSLARLRTTGRMSFKQISGPDTSTKTLKIQTS